MSKIVQLPHVKKINSIIERFNERLEFSDFLKIIDLVVEGKLASKEALALFENAKTKGLQPLSRWDSLFKSLARIDFTQTFARLKTKPLAKGQEAPSDSGADQLKRPVDAEFQQTLDKLTESIGDMNKQHEQIKNYQENPYYVFYPALEIQNDLEAEFQGVNPGKVIGSYLRAFFGDAHAHEEYRPSFAFTCDSHFRMLVMAIYLWKQETTSQVKQGDKEALSDSPSGDIHLMDFDSLCFGLWCGVNASPDPCLMQILADAPKLSQKLFESILWHWLFLFEGKHVKSMAIDTFIMYLPIGDSYSLYDLPKDLYGFTEEGESNARFAERFWDASVDLGKVPFIPWPILCKLVDMRPIFSLYSDTDDEETRSGETQFRHAADGKMNWDVGRYRRLFGCSPLDIDDLQNLCIGYSHENADLLVLLGRTASPMNNYPFGLISLVDDETDDEPNHDQMDSWHQLEKAYKKSPEGRHQAHLSKMRQMRVRAEYYFKLIKQAKDEGFDELATNALSFFLFSQAGATGKLLAPINELSPLVEQLLSKPGKEMLRHAITFASNMTRESGELITALVLNSWVSQRQPELKIIEPTARRPHIIPVDIGRQVASNQLLENLGAERASRFSEEAFQSMVEAEIQWSKLHQEFGRGLKDWGTLGLALVKPIEIELVRRIGAACKSDSHAKFLKMGGKQPIGKLTLGPLLHMLKDFDRLPSDVQQSITSSGVRLHENSDLIRDLISIVNPLRNKGAHSEPFSDKDYLKLRSTLFIDGRLKLLLDLLSKPKGTGSD